MNNCINHPNKEATSLCHGCGDYFCESCLDEGSEFYYCKKPECQKLLTAESGVREYTAEYQCPNCNVDLDLSDDERAKGKFHCPECEAFIDVTVDPPRVSKKENYVLLLSSLNQGDIAVLKSVLEDAEIDYYVAGENFLSVRPLLEPAKFFVNETQVEETQELLKDFDLHIWGASTSS